MIRVGFAALAILLLTGAAAQPQACKRTGNAVSCDDGRVGTFTGDAIVWPDGTRSRAAAQNPSVIIGNRGSVQVGPGVFVGRGSGGMEPMDDPGKKRCAVLDGISYCH
jgi:hypothetical protein